MPDGYLNTKSDLLLLHLQSSTPSLLLLLISHHLVLLSTACPTSLASEPNIRGGRSGVQMAPGAVRRSEGSTTISQRSKRDRDTEPDLIRNQDILRKISTTKNLPRSFVMGSEASERSEKNSITTSKATQRGTVTFPVDLYFKRSGRAALNFFFRVGDSSCGCTHGAPPAASDAAADALV